MGDRKKVPLLTKLLIAMVVGIMLGAIFGEKITVIKPFGTVFLNLLKMAALPLVIVNLIAGISSLNDPKIFGRVGVKILVYYAVTTILAIVVGILTGYLFQPGVGFTLQGEYKGAIEKIPSFGETIIGLLPSNIFAALTSGRFDQIIVFSAFVGIAILFLPEKEKLTLAHGFAILAELFNKMVGIIMLYAPIGICALMACTVGVYGKQLAGFLTKYLGASYLSVIVQICFYCLIVFFVTHRNPLHVLKKGLPTIVTGLSTSSSLACVPVNLDCADSLKVPRSISSFTIPLGSQVNKDGNGIMLWLTFIFAAQAIGSPLSFGILLKVIFLSLILTTGAGGVPGGGIVTIAIIMDAFGLPLEIVGIIAGIFALIDMAFTMLNCLGDLFGTYLVAWSEEKRALACGQKVEVPLD